MSDCPRGLLHPVDSNRATGMLASNKMHVCSHTSFAWRGVGGGQQKRKKQKPYLLGGNFFALTSPLGSTLNNQEQRINQNPKTPIRLVLCFSQGSPSLAGRACGSVKSGSASPSSPRSQVVFPRM